MASSSSDRPLVAVTGIRLPAGKPFRLEPAVAIQSYYTDSLDRAGAIPVVLTPVDLDGELASATLAHVSGLVLTGGSDIDPARYDQFPHPSVYGTDPQRDAFEATLLHAALDAGLPVLAICRGLQLVNVEFGGTLHQNLGDDPARGPHGIPDGGGPSHNTITLSPGTLAHHVMSGDEVSGNCHHHQAVDRVGAGLRVTGRTADGTVEVLELAEEPTSWFLAVQWHPEETAAQDPPNQALFDHLVAAARR